MRFLRPKQSCGGGAWAGVWPCQVSVSFQMCKSFLRSSKLASGLEGLWSKASPLPGVEIQAPTGWRWPLEGSTIKSIRKSHFSEQIWLCRGCTAGTDGQTSASPVGTQGLQAACCPLDGAVQEQKQTRGEERTCHDESGTRGSRSR